MLDARQRAEAAGFILAACDAGQLVDVMPEPRPHDLADAYAVQDLVFSRRGDGAAGWFASATNRSMLKQLGLEEPYAARWRAGRKVGSPALVRQPGQLPIALEAEVTFELRRDLPARAAAYGEDEVLDAVAAVRPSFEVVISCFADWMNQPPLNLIAEGGTEQVLVCGAAHPDWRSLDLAALPVRVLVDGAERAAGSTSLVLDGPVSVLVWLANHASRRGFGLKAGQYCNTGMCAPVHFASVGERAVAHFGPLGTVEVTVG